VVSREKESEKEQEQRIQSPSFNDRTKNTIGRYPAGCKTEKGASLNLLSDISCI